MEYLETLKILLEIVVLILPLLKQFPWLAIAITIAAILIYLLNRNHRNEDSLS